FAPTTDEALAACAFAAAKKAAQAALMASHFTDLVSAGSANPDIDREPKGRHAASYAREVRTRGRRLASVAVLGVVVLCVQAAPVSAASSTHRIAIDRQGFWLGPLVWSAETSKRAVSLGDFIRVFGP